MKKNYLNVTGMILLFVMITVNLFGLTNGTADGTYDFGTLGAVNSGGTGYKTAGDKFVVSNSFDVFGGALYLDDVATATVEFKAEGGSTMKQATLQNMVLGMAGGVVTITQFDISLKNASGVAIATHTLPGDHEIDMVDGDVSISTLALSPAWPVAGYDNVAEISITYNLSASTPNFEFRSTTLANISNTVVSNNAPTAASFTAGTIYQGTAYVFATANFGYSDGDGDALDNIRIDGVPAHGSLWVDADGSNSINGGESALSNSGTISKTDLDAGRLKYLNTNGTSTSFTFSVNDGTDYSATSYTTTLTVTPLPTVAFTAASQSSTNETGTMTITAELSATSAQTVSVPFTVNGSSTATGSGTDYSISTSPLSIAPGNTTASITITIATDALDEDDETIIVDMGTPTNANQGTTTSHTATITDDDNPPTVSFTSVSQASTNESGTMTVTAALSGASGKNVSVPFTVNGSSTATGSGTDYTISSSPLTINAGSSSADITMTIATDIIVEGNETVIVDMGTPVNASQGANTTHTATITDDDIPSVSFTTASQSSTNETGTMTITAELSAATNSTVTVPFTVNGSSTATGSGTDYSISASPLSITSGNTTASITITIATDALDEDDETVIVDMGTPTNANQGTTTSHTATITDDDNPPTVNFTAASQSSTSESGTMTISALLSSASGKTVSIPFTVNGSSTATGSGTDYSISSSPLTIQPGDRTADITITIATDNIDEFDETVIVNIGIPANATKGVTTNHTATIIDDDAEPSVTLSASTSTSTAESGSLIVTAMLSAPSAKDITIPFTVGASSTATGLGTDYTITSSPLTINAGSSSADITVTIVSEDLDETDETVIIDMGTPTNATQGATTSETLTITDDDETPVVTASQEFPVDENSTGTIGTAVATDTDAGTTYQSWTITSNVNGDGDGNNAFSISPTSGQITINDADDLDRESDEQLTISVTVSDGTNTSAEETVIISLDDVNDVTPVITAAQTFSVPDNKPFDGVIDTVKATDGDVTTTSLENWTIVTNVNPDLDGNNAFSINAATGAIKVNDTDDLVVNATHNLGITVSDGLNTSIETTVVINVIASNADPVITSTTTPSVDENTTAVQTVTVTDTDGDNVIFSITGGADMDLFDITTGGVLSFKSAKDFENAEDADKNNKYLVEVTADDQKTGKDVASLVVNLVDVNELPIVHNQEFTIQENSPVNTSIGNIVATDPENLSLTYTINGVEASKALSVNANTGEITIKDSALVDYELTDTIKFNIEVSDTSLMSSAEVIVALVNINDNAPQLGTLVYSIDENPEKGEVVGILDITDADGDISSAITVDVLSGNEDLAFSYDSEKMELSVNKPEIFDYETKKSFTINIRISDGELTTDKTVTVNVNDVDDGTSVSEFEVESINIYPNPVSDQLVIESVDLLSLQLIDGAGKVVLESEIQVNESYINVSNLSEGAYILILKSNKDIVSKKIVIER